jgi:hypothetical protein
LAERERYAWNTLRPIVAMALVVAFALVPAFVVFAGTFHLLEAKVCVEDRADPARVRGRGGSSPCRPSGWRSS